MSIQEKIEEIRRRLWESRFSEIENEFSEDEIRAIEYGISQRTEQIMRDLRGQPDFQEMTSKEQDRELIERALDSKLANVVPRIDRDFVERMFMTAELETWVEWALENNLRM